MRSFGKDLIYLPGIEANYDPFPVLDSFQLKQETIRIFGKEILQPRLSQLFGDSNISYTYSQKKLDAMEWNPFLSALKIRLEKTLSYEFNSALVNLYRDGNDSMGLHSDDEKELGTDPVIASVSYGATRKMIFRRKKDKHKEILYLNHGDIILMRGKIQQDWKHEIPKEKGILIPRINITFRYIHI